MKRKDDDEGDDDKQETEQEKLEREASELSGQLKKVERAEAQAREKDQKDRTKTLQPTDYEWKVPETSKSRDVGRDEETKVDEDGRHS